MAKIKVDKPIKDLIFFPRQFTLSDICGYTKYPFPKPDPRMVTIRKKIK